MLRLGPMQDKSQTSTQRLLELRSHRLLQLSGPDAVSFAQGQFMNDVEALAEGEWQWSGWLTPKGRLAALFALLRVDDAVLLLLPDADPAGFAAALGRFVFRAKVRVEAVQGRVSGALAAPAAATGKRLAEAHGRLELDLGGEGGPRTLWIERGVAAGTDPDGSAEWAVADLLHGLPRLPAGDEPQWTPQQLSLERLAAFSVRKGCYPGQEIVARTHFLGKAKRGLVLLEGNAPLSPGLEVRAGDAAAGTIASAASDGDRHLALAVMPLERPEGQLAAGAVELCELPLLGGLGR